MSRLKGIRCFYTCINHIWGTQLNHLLPLSHSHNGKWEIVTIKLIWSYRDDGNVVWWFVFFFNDICIVMQTILKMSRFSFDSNIYVCVLLQKSNAENIWQYPGFFFWSVLMSLVIYLIHVFLCYKYCFLNILKCLHMIFLLYFYNRDCRLKKKYDLF